MMMALLTLASATIFAAHIFDALRASLDFSLRGPSGFARRMADIASNFAGILRKIRVSHFNAFSVLADVNGAAEPARGRRATGRSANESSNRSTGTAIALAQP